MAKNNKQKQFAVLGLGRFGTSVALTLHELGYQVLGVDSDEEIVQDLSHGTYTNVLELGSQFVRYSLQRWLSSWEADISRQLLGPIARRRYHAEHSVDALLRGNPEARATFYQTMIAAGVMDAEEARSLENFPARKVPHGS